ncbi:OmpA family protein [Variovorax sp. MHTC-1]|uniref:OmpA family protein n=1 Tax=Variovorax sp. MHTC-1 TaxID=2495593 RepID=UPI000F893F27|nr:OmpA family protein [Variovorax sp. MHTC-1]RST47792.1 flagellar motor protein MotB [Variovorax sp. MHTC-1]
MKSTRSLRLLSLAGVGALIATTALGQEGGYYYGGLSVGQSHSRIDDERITAGLLGAGLSTTSMSLDEHDAAFKLFGGYQFNRYLALEGGYFNLGKFGYMATTSPAGTLHGKIKLQGLNLDVVGTLPLSERFSAIGRVGVQVANARDSFSGTGTVQVLNPSPSKRDTNYKFGVGLQYEFSPSFLVRGEVERYRINDAVGNKGDINLFSVTLVFPLGRVPAPTPRAAVASTYIAAAPEPASAAAAPEPVVAVPSRRVSFSADSLFNFDQSTLRPEGRAALDQFMTDLTGTQFDVIDVEGHTDRLGSAAYNRKLSLRRAESVKGYLTTNGQIAAAKVSAVGKGESAPVTRLEVCTGNRPSRTLIACLQPDRRVEVEVSGIR